MAGEIEERSEAFGFERPGFSFRVVSGMEAVNQDNAVGLEFLEDLPDCALACAEARKVDGFELQIGGLGEECGETGFILKGLCVGGAGILLVGALFGKPGAAVKVDQERDGLPIFGFRKDAESADG